MKGADNDGVVMKGRGDDGKWWRWEVVRKGSGEEGKRWRWEVVRKVSGEEGKWWWRGVVRKGSGEEGNRWRWEVVRKGSGEEGKWWWRGVVRKGSGEEGKRWRRQVVSWGGSRSTKPCVFPCKVAAAGDDKYLVCAAVAAAVVWFLLCVLQQWLFLCVVLCVSWSCGCRSHWNGCMNVAWASFWRGSRSTKPCVFPCKVAAAGDDKYLVCAAVAAAVVWFLLCVLQQWLFLCVVLCVSWSCGCRSHWNGRMNVACCVLWGEEAEARNLAFFRVKWLQPAMKGTSCVCGGCGCSRLVPSMCFATMVVPVCVVLCVSWSRGCRSHWNVCVKVAWCRHRCA